MIQSNDEKEMEAAIIDILNPYNDKSTEVMAWLLVTQEGWRKQVMAPKVPFICDDGDTPYEDYKCGNCGCKTCIEDANFCPKCGASLYFEEE